MTEWPILPAGAKARIVKVSPSGEIAAEYAGRVIEAGARTPWIALEATWTHNIVELDGLRFLPGDRLHEFFSPVHGFNVFSIWTPGNDLRGWYANVTRPPYLDLDPDPPRLFWYDLYVDLIALPDGTTTVRDEDELAASGMASFDPELHASVLETRDELIRRGNAREFPFHEASWNDTVHEGCKMTRLTSD